MLKKFFGIFRKPELHVGQVWQMKDENPFAEKYQARITELRDGYVRYNVYTVSYGENPKNIGNDAFHKKESKFRYIYKVFIRG